MIREIKDFRESGARGELFVPASIGPLRVQQVFDALVEAAAGGVAAGEQPENRPGGLGRRARGRAEGAVVVAGAAFAPASVRVLDGAQPLARAQYVRFAIVFPCGA